MLIAFAIPLVAGCLLWILGAFVAARVIRALPRLADTRPALPHRSALVSVIVPCRDEADDLPAALAARLADPDPALQFILLDDRSTDDTGVLLDKAAGTDDRVQVVHIETLPAGWLGKPHAMKAGIETAEGEWLLFTDADVQLVPGTIRRAVDWCEQERLDFLALLPEVWSSGFAVDAAVATFGRMFVLTTRIWAVSDPDSDASLGVGAFNLVRRSAYERTEGMDWLRMETADDLGLAKMLKTSGAACGVAAGSGLAGLYWYRSVSELAVGLEKNTFAVLHCSLPRIAALALAGLFLDLAPLLALLPLGIPGLPVLAGLAIASGLGTSVAMTRWSRGPLWPTLAWPLGSLIMTFVLLRAGVVGTLRGGIRWRGTFHSSAELRAGRRI